MIYMTISFQSHYFLQRVALSIAVNMCKKLPADAAEFVTNAVPLLTPLLQYQDAKVRPYLSIQLTATCNHKGSLS